VVGAAATYKVLSPACKVYVKDTGCETVTLLLKTGEPRVVVMLLKIAPLAEKIASLPVKLTEFTVTVLKVESSAATLPVFATIVVEAILPSRAPFEDGCATSARTVTVVYTSFCNGIMRSVKVTVEEAVVFGELTLVSLAV
jgi:hypothetical protein